MDMAEHPEGFSIDQEQALLVICSTQVLPSSSIYAARRGLSSVRVVVGPSIAASHDFWIAVMSLSPHSPDPSAEQRTTLTHSVCCVKSLIALENC